MPPRPLRLEDHIEMIRNQYEFNKDLMSKLGYRITMVILNFSRKADTIFAEWIRAQGYRMALNPKNWTAYYTKEPINLRCYFYPDTMTDAEAQEERIVYASTYQKL